MVTFNKNGEDIDASLATRSATYGGNVGTLPTAPIKGGYTFIGWNTIANGSGTAFDATTAVIVSNTVFAQWNAIPNIPNYTKNTNKNISVIGSVYGTDADGNTLTYSKGSNPFNGALTVNANGTYTFTPDTNYTGTDSFNVTVSDGCGGIATCTITINVATLEFKLVGTITDKDTGSPVNNSKVELKDLYGNMIKSYTTGSDGRYSFESLVENKYNLVVQNDSYSSASKESNVNVGRAVNGIIAEDIEMVKFKINLVANPSSIVGNGTDNTMLTTTVLDKNSVPAEGVTVTFSALLGTGTFPNGTNTETAVTNAQGQATIKYTSSVISGTTEQVIPVTAKVADSVKGLFAENQILITFEPGAISGVVTDNATHAPVRGAKITVSKDFNDDGIVDFVGTQITGADGKYEIAIPIGNVKYNIDITKPVVIGNLTVDMTFSQNGDAGNIPGGAKVTYNSVKTAAGYIVIQNTDGTQKLLQDNLNYRLEVVNGSGSIANGLNAKINSNGTFSAENLEENKHYTVNVKYKVAEGKEIITGKVDVSVNKAGEINLSQILIDPYGTITNANTGAVIPGVKVELYFADTARNVASGNTPNALVTLPAIAGFAPNDNANPQNSDSTGKYAFMVYPNSDYYMKASKDGFVLYTSPTISVEAEIVKYDFAMTQNPVGGDVFHGSIIPSTPNTLDLAVSLWAESMRLEEGQQVILTVKYVNLSKAQAQNVTIGISVPEGLDLIDGAGGSYVNGNLKLNIGSLAGNSQDSKVISFTTKNINQGEVKKLFLAEINSSDNLLNKQDDTSRLEIMIYSNRYDHLHQGYVMGYPDGEYKPDKFLTRAETATVLARLLDLQSLVKHEIVFKDVTLNHWASGYIEAAYKKGIIKGYDDGSYKPDEAITRAEFSTMVSRYLQIANETGKPAAFVNFEDLKGHWSQGSIEELFRYKVVMGYQDGTFKPDSSIIRAEAFTIINRMLYRGPISNVTSSWRDVKNDHWAKGHTEESSRTHEFKFKSDGTEEVIRFIDAPLW